MADINPSAPSTPVRDVDLSAYSDAAPPPVTDSNSGAAPLAPGMDKNKQLNTVPLTPEQVGDWWDRIKKSEELIEKKGVKWDMLLSAYLPIVTNDEEDIKYQGHFRNVHTKIGQVFVKSPKVVLDAKGPLLDAVMVPTQDPLTGAVVMKPMTPEEAVLIKQHVVNEYMGPDHIDGLRLMDEGLFDILAWAGSMCVKVGYKVVSKPIQRSVMGPDPTFAAQPPPPGSILGLQPQVPPQVPMIDQMTGQPKMETVQVPIYQEWYAKRFSPKKLILPVNLKASNVNKEATFLGMKFYMSKREIMRNFGIAEADLKAGVKDEDVANPTQSDIVDSDTDMVKGYEIFYRAACYTEEVHPLAVNQLILFEGMKNDITAVSRKSPDQTFDEQGKLTPDSLTILPIIVGSNRDQADDPLPLPDSAFTNNQIKYLSTHRSQGVKLRDAQIGKYVYDVEAWEDNDLQLLKNGNVGEFIGAKGGSMNQGLDKIFARTTTVQGSQDDYRMAGLVKSDMDETIGISSTQAGVPTEGIRSATEVNKFGNASQGRMKKEQARIVGIYLLIVRAVDTLLTRYASGENYIMVEGEDGAKRIAQWNKKILSAGVYGYSIKADSQLDNDVAQDRQQRLSFYNLTAADPLVNRPVLLRSLARDFGEDPSKIIIDPALIAAGGGLPPHGGPANKHESENSGATPNGPDTGNRQQRNPRPGGGA